MRPASSGAFVFPGLATSLPLCVQIEKHPAIGPGIQGREIQKRPCFQDLRRQCALAGQGRRAYGVSMIISRLFDLFGLVSAGMAAWFWYKASDFKMRRISKDESFDRFDMNRMITELNRSQALNRRAALATALAAVAVALKFAYDIALTL
jgi:hypothetical protein